MKDLPKSFPPLEEKLVEIFTQFVYVSLHSFYYSCHWSEHQPIPLDTTMKQFQIKWLLFDRVNLLGTYSSLRDVNRKQPAPGSPDMSEKIEDAFLWMKEETQTVHNNLITWQSRGSLQA